MRFEGKPEHLSILYRKYSSEIGMYDTKMKLIILVYNSIILFQCNEYVYRK